MPIILFRLVTAAKSMARKSSEGVCHTSGNGVGIKCKIGTLKKKEKTQAHYYCANSFKQTKKHRKSIAYKRGSIYKLRSIFD